MAEQISLGVDFGGTKIEAAVIGQNSGEGRQGDVSFRVLAKQRVPTERDRGYEAVLETTLSVVRATAKEAGLDLETLPIGVGMPGSVTRRDGLVKNSNTLCLNGRPFRQDIEQRLKARVWFENDANCFALAEARLGAGRAYAEGVVFGVIMGTGVGGGLIVRGRPWAGIQGLAGEWGHHAVGPWRRPEQAGTVSGAGLGARPVCSCGRYGCLELYASGGGIEREYTRRSGETRRLAELLERQATDAHASVLLDELLEAFGRGLANVIDILDPSAVVLGGGVSNLEILYTEGRARVAKYVFNDELATPILRHELGDSAGVIGAALLPERGASGA
jgi:fructokinase